MVSVTDEIPTAIAVSVACLTDKGQRRAANEDAFIVADLEETGFKTSGHDLARHQIGARGLLLAVADGMGGAKAGEVASRLAVEQLVRSLGAPSQNEMPADRLRGGLKLANRAIRQASDENLDYSGMGSTMTAALVSGGQAIIGQVGDSRGYLIRGNEVRQITKDQSFAQALIDAGELTEEQGAHSPERHLILQALGGRDEIEPKIGTVALMRGDHLLLCTDYLARKVRAADMLDIIRTAETLSGACVRLVALANERGGEDNITVLLARFD